MADDKAQDANSDENDADTEPVTDDDASEAAAAGDDVDDGAGDGDEGVPELSERPEAALEGADDKERLAGIMYSERQWVVAEWIKAAFTLSAVLLLIGLVAYGVDKRMTMWRLTMDSVVEPTPLKGIPAYDFVLQEGRENKGVKLEEFRGKWVFLNFWATWCPPCRDEMPSMEMLKRKFGDDVVMLAVSVDEDWNEVERFFGGTKPSFRVLWDRRKAVSRAYGVRKFPETFLISPEGKVVTKFIGPRDWYNLGTVQYFEDILAGRRDPTS